SRPRSSFTRSSRALTAFSSWMSSGTTDAEPGLLPFTATFGDLPLFGTTTAWWVPLLVVAVFGTALAYATGITASGLLGSRLASFVALLEVVSASLFAWLLLGEKLTPLQLVGGLLILGGIASVRAERTAVEPAVAPPVAASCP
ncbi:EamA family transporter, partial [Lentzea sp. PSKA42]